MACARLTTLREPLRITPIRAWPGAPGTIAGLAAAFVAGAQGTVRMTRMTGTILLSDAEMHVAIDGAISSQRMRFRLRNSAGMTVTLSRPTAATSLLRSIAG